jgi:hypothetical protein
MSDHNAVSRGAPQHGAIDAASNNVNAELQQNALHFHLTTLQNIITRMANNSFAVRNWAITFVAGGVALLVQSGQRKAALLLLPAVLLFTWLDAYYVYAERQFRQQYDAAVGRAQGKAVESADLYLVQPLSCQFRDVVRTAKSVTVLPMLVCNVVPIGYAVWCT